MIHGEGIPMMMRNMMQGMMGNMEGRQYMMKEMMKDAKIMGNMMMHEKGIMSEDCMESCKKMMEGRGMDMNKMGNMDSPTKGDHTENH